MLPVAPKSMTPNSSAKAVLAEAKGWQTIMSRDEERALDVYLDIKSPHSYLAVRPSLEVARDYKVQVNFLPYTLSYVGLGLTTSVQPDNKRRPANLTADRKARMYYAAARQYAALQGLPFRSPYRLLDSTSANKAFLFAKTQKLEVPFLMQVYVQGWGSGWRNYEIESLDQLSETLGLIGANTDGFEAYMQSEGLGDTTLRSCMEKAETSGVTGVPHYVFYDTPLGQKLGLFGREHLALIREKFAADGLARTSSVRPEFSHAWHGPKLTP